MSLTPSDEGNEGFYGGFSETVKNCQISVKSAVVSRLSLIDLHENEGKRRKMIESAQKRWYAEGKKKVSKMLMQERHAVILKLLHVRACIITDRKPGGAFEKLTAVRVAE